ncbi:MAG: hypothetical protein AAFU79_23720, partial [Myxococcota bacterium]
AVTGDTVEVSEERRPGFTLGEALDGARAHVGTAVAQADLRGAVHLPSTIALTFRSARSCRSRFLGGPVARQPDLNAGSAPPRPDLCP